MILSKDSLAGFFAKTLVKLVHLRAGFAMAAVFSMAAATGWRVPTE